MAPSASCSSMIKALSRWAPEAYIWQCGGVPQYGTLRMWHGTLDVRKRTDCLELVTTI
jgi:hypothetical protein